jgi:hypothetical protein
MKESLYRGYRIIATAQKEGRVWRSHARISLLRGRRRATKLRDDETLFDSERDAEEHAMRLGHHWVNGQLQRKQFS